jgi:hypothetical protein
MLLLNSDNPKPKHDVSARSIASLKDVMPWEPEQRLLRRLNASRKLENHAAPLPGARPKSDVQAK